MIPLLLKEAFGLPLGYGILFVIVGLLSYFILPKVADLGLKLIGIILLIWAMGIFALAIYTTFY